jgi:hypothetical protein
MDEQVSQNTFKSTTPLEDGGGSSRDGDGGCSNGDFMNVVTGSKWWRNM